MDDFSRTILHLYEAARECRLDEFHDHALGVAKKTLHFDSCVVVNAAVHRPDVELLSMHIHNQPLEKFHDRQGLKGDPTLTKALRQAGQCLADELDLLDPKKHRDVIDYARKYDVAYSLVLVAPSPQPQCVDVVSLWRAPRGRRFGTQGERLGDMLLPHVLMARQLNEQMGGVATDGAGALLVAGFDGCVRFVDTHAVAWLQKEWPQWSPPLLPQPLLAAFAGNPARVWTGRQLHARAEVHGTSLYVRLRARPAGPRLTSAERAAALCAARGLSYKAIAGELGLSPATVRNQLHHVYRKLGVAGKAELAHRLGRLGEDGDPVL